MKKLAICCWLLIASLALCLTAYAEPRVMAEQCPECMHDATLRTRLDGFTYTLESHEDHSDCYIIYVYYYYWKCTNNGCGHSWETGDYYNVKQLYACPFVG